MPKKTFPLVSIIVVNYNGAQFLPQCLKSISSQSYPNFETIIVDNNSQDNSLKIISQYPRVKLIRNKQNVGFASACNIGAKHSKGEYLFFLNSDVFLGQNCLRSLMNFLAQNHNIAIAQPKLLIAPDFNKLDACGAFLTDTGFLYHWGYLCNKNEPIFNQPTPVFSVKGAAMLVKKTIYNQVGGMDEDFWCFYEETDLCHRIWLIGKECWYYPVSVAYHQLGGSAKFFPGHVLQFHNFKNKLASFLKNFKVKTLLLIIPIYLFLNVFLSLVWLLKGKFRNAFVLHKAIFWNVSNFKKTLSKRQRIQNKRQYSDKQLFKKLRKNPTISFWLRLIKKI